MSENEMQAGVEVLSGGIRYCFPTAREWKTIYRDKLELWILEDEYTVVALFSEWTHVYMLRKGGVVSEKSEYAKPDAICPSICIPGGDADETPPESWITTTGEFDMDNQA